MTVDGIIYLADVARSRYVHAEHAHSEHREFHAIDDLTFLDPRVCYAMKKRIVRRSRRGAPRLHIMIQSVSTVAFQLDDRLCDTIGNASKIRFLFEHAMASRLRRGTYTRLLWHCHR